MRHSLRWALVLLTLPTALPALAQTPRFIGTHSDWTVYEVSDSRGKVCYIASEPTSQEGNYSRRGNPAALVARLPGDPPNFPSRSLRPAWQSHRRTAEHGPMGHQLSRNCKSLALRGRFAACVWKGRHRLGSAASCDGSVL